MVLAFLLGLVIATAGTATAARLITGKQIKDGTITQKDLAKAVRVQLAKAGSPGPKGDPGPLVTPEPWHEIGAPGEPQFSTGAANAKQSYVCSGPEPQPDGCPSYNTAGFYKDPFGVVHLKGTIKRGPSTIPFRLPPGYRPARAAVFPIDVSTDVVARVIVYDDVVQLDLPAGSTGTETYSLDGVSFRAAG